jgi:arylsulfatase A-like enzyme
MHTYDTHCPYVCREPFNSMFCRDHSRHIPLEGRCNQVNLGRTPLMKTVLTASDLQAVSDHYDGSIACADADLGDFFATLRGLGIYGEALIIVTSDHGESLGEHDQIGHGGLYLEQLRVPLIVKFPKSWNVAAAVVESAVELVDVMPTVYDACGMEQPDGVTGRSLLPLVQGSRWNRRFAIAQTTHQEGRAASSNAAKRAVLVPGEWLLIHDARTDAAEMFDLGSDAKGLSDIGKPQPAAAENLLSALTAHDPADTGGEFAMPAHSPMSDELRRQLETLGYTGR